MTPTLESRLRAVEDELAIRALVARFSDCCNERDFVGFAALWAADGVWEIGHPLPARAEGVPSIVELLRRLLVPQIMFMQMTHSGIVKLNGDTANARFVEHERGRGQGQGKGNFYENLAVYDDELVRQADGQWRFARRSYRYRLLDDAPFGGQVFPVTG